MTAPMPNRAYHPRPRTAMVLVNGYPWAAQQGAETRRADDRGRRPWQTRCARQRITQTQCGPQREIPARVALQDVQRAPRVHISPEMLEAIERLVRGVVAMQRPASTFRPKRDFESRLVFFCGAVLARRAT